jgi:hypothetical protein
MRICRLDGLTAIAWLKQSFLQLAVSQTKAKEATAPTSKFLEDHPITSHKAANNRRSILISY